MITSNKDFFAAEEQAIAEAEAIAANTTTTNVHSVGNFNPSEYEVVDYLDNQRPRYYGQRMEVWQAEIEAWKASIRQYFPTCACATTGNVRQLPHHNIHKCGHCGQTNVRYICAVLHVPTGDYVVFGDVCVEHLGFRNHSEFRAAQVRARAAQGNANLRAYRARLQFLEAHQGLADVVNRWDAILANPVHRDNTFIRDIMDKFNRYGALSERQIECLMASIQRDVRRAEERAARAARQAEVAASGAVAPSGRQQVQGVVLSCKAHDSAYGTCWKMLVEFDNGTKAYSTVPASIASGNFNLNELRGKRISFTATFTQKPEDRTFSYANRPTKASIIEQ